MTKRCSGINYKRLDCDRIVGKDEKYCKTHEYFYNFTNEIVESIRNNTGSYKLCGGCNKWIIGETTKCVACLEKSREYKQKIKKNKEKCGGKDRNDNECRNDTISGLKYCKYHEYMKDYTVDMLNNMSYCLGCRKKYYKPGEKLCITCRNRNEKNKNNKFEADNRPICKRACCDYKVKNGEEYCGKHSVHGEKIKLEKSGVKLCANFMRGCKKHLENGYEYSKCTDCLELDRKRGKKLYEKKHNAAFETKNDEFPLCPKCLNNVPAKEFLNGDRGRRFEHCDKCRQKQYENDTRINRERNFAEYENREEVKEMRHKWKEENKDKIK